MRGDRNIDYGLGSNKDERASLRRGTHLGVTQHVAMINGWHTEMNVKITTGIE
jgi:hypothetical protein